MRPVNHTSLGVPLKFSIEFYGVTLLQPGNSRGEINVVCNQHCLTRLQLENEALMPATAIVVSKDSSHNARSMHLGVACICTKFRTRRTECVGVKVAVAKVGNGGDDDCGKELVHCFTTLCLC